MTRLPDSGSGGGGAALPVRPSVAAFRLHRLDIGPAIAGHPITLSLTGNGSADSMTEAKARLVAGMAPGNVEKTSQAPVSVIVGMDMAFYEHLPRLFPHANARSWFAGNDAAIFATAFRNSTLQGGYLIMAARALGLDTGAMSGFDAQKVDEAFFAGTTVKSNFLINLGYGDASKLFERSPRFAFDEVAKIV